MDQPCSFSPPKTPTQGPLSLGGVPIWGTGAQLRDDSLCPRVGSCLSFPSSSSSALCQPQRFRALSPDPGDSALASAGPGKALTVQDPSTAPLQQCVTVVAHVEGRVWQGGPWEPGLPPTWMGLHRPGLTTTCDQSTVSGCRPRPVCLALHVLGSLALTGTRPAPHSALVGWSKELHWPRSCLVLPLRAECPQAKLKVGLHGAHGQGWCALGMAKGL